MHSPKKLQILKLYKDLLRYGQQLKLTDKDYFCDRVRRDFLNNKCLTDQKDINHNFEVNLFKISNSTRLFFFQFLERHSSSSESKRTITCGEVGFLQIPINSCSTFEINTQLIIQKFPS